MKLKGAVKIALKYIEHTFQGWSFAQLQFMDKVQSFTMLQHESVHQEPLVLGVEYLGFHFSSLILSSSFPL